MTDIPDISDSPPLSPKTDNPSEAMGKLNIDDRGDTINEEEIPDMDDIPDMDEAAGLEEEGDDAAVRIVHPSESVWKCCTSRHWKLMRIGRM
jgi:ubiquitin-like-conjugating enzyme ATG3